MLCAIEDCENERAKGDLCWAHLKRRQRGQPLSEAVAKRPASAFERLTEAAIAYKEAKARLRSGAFARLTEAAEGYADADAEEDFARARDNLRKAAGAYGRPYALDVAREGLDAARARGVRLGRPPKLSRTQVEAAYAQAGSVRKAAQALGVHRLTVMRALRRVVHKTGY